MSLTCATGCYAINADIAYAPTQYIEATGDRAFEEEVGLEVLVETVRLWGSLGYYHVATDQFRIDGVTGPDEYSALADNNVYTNLMAQHNLHSPAEVVQRYPDKARAFGVDVAEIDSWLQAAESSIVQGEQQGEEPLETFGSA